MCCVCSKVPLTLGFCIKPDHCDQNLSHCNQNLSHCDQNLSHCYQNLSHCDQDLSHCDQNLSHCEIVTRTFHTVTGLCPTPRCPGQWHRPLWSSACRLRECRTARWCSPLPASLRCTPAGWCLLLKHLSFVRKVGGSSACLWSHSNTLFNRKSKYRLLHHWRWTFFYPRDTLNEGSI